MSTSEISPKDVNFAFLVLKEHPYGQEMLRQLMEAGFVPSIIIEEAGKIAETEREKFLVRIKGQELPPTFTEQLEGLDVRREEVPHHNKEECQKLLEETKPDIIVLGGTRIIKPNIFTLGKYCLNSHPGLLPECRGSASVAWSVFHDINIGSTCHFIDENIDTGSIIYKEVYPVQKGDTYEKLCHATIGLSGKLMTNALKQYVEKGGEIVAEPQDESIAGETYRNAPDEVLEVVYKKLAEESYGCYAEE
eukprot:TRINITY_DN3984_c0_g1_i3.p1 TRINITY_DN3984_c0_g1~~TRINITY_DN3984_c0_g1_i3.p1  ORF type:complete len:249 (+),score=89.94 TRINITY_DN3984_c0_g1_i3:1315-2061(+)